MFCMVLLVGVVSAADYKFQNKSGSDLMVIHGDTGNVTVTGNVSATAGFFSWLGSLLNRVTTLFVQDVDFTGLINGSGWINTTANVSASYYYGDGSKLENLPSGGADGALNSSGWNRTVGNVFLANFGDNVGIGTIAPKNKLQVEYSLTDGQQYGFIGSTDQIHILENAYYDGSWKSIEAGTAAGFQTYGGGSEALKVFADTSVAGADEALSLDTVFTVQTDGDVITKGDLTVNGGNLNLDDTANAQNSRIDWYATDGDTGYVEYTTSDRWEWRNGGFYIRNEVPITYIYSNLIYLGTSGDTTTTYLQGNLMTGDKFRLEALSGSLALGSASDPGIYELDVVGQMYVSDYLVALGGIYAGAVGDPGTDNLIVYGNLVASANSRESLAETACSDGAACYCPSGKIMYGIRDRGGDEYNIYCAEL